MNKEKKVNIAEGLMSVVCGLIMFLSIYGVYLGLEKHVYKIDNPMFTILVVFAFGLMATLIFLVWWLEKQKKPKCRKYI